jgi:hypothetical protein
MSSTVSPRTFTFVSFDAEVIERVADSLIASLGITDHPVTIAVDETTPLARVRMEIGETIAIFAESGAFEDMRKPRQLSENAIATSLGRVLLRARDRLGGGFGEAPADADLTLAQMAAWEAYCVGRLERLGIKANQQRWRYNFRNRHGFHDRSDATFDQLWASEGLTWGALEELSRAAVLADA